MSVTSALAKPTTSVQQKAVETLDPIGRFAPSPTGRLHLGSLTTAIASYCHIKSLSACPSSLSQTSTVNASVINSDVTNNIVTNSGITNHKITNHRITGAKWLLRIEDVDRQRCKAQYSDAILQDLERLGLYWDDTVVYQSQRTQVYNDYINEVIADHSYACQCSRKSLKGAVIYPRHCLKQRLDKTQHKLRFCLPDQLTGFFDGIQGMQWQNPQQTLGDMVIRRDQHSQNMINYILAVSIDDGLQGVTHIMRGLDILPMTSAQIAIMRLAKLPAIAAWYHLPLINNEQGQKLSKQNLAQPIDTSSTERCSRLIETALDLLQQPKVALDTPERMLAQAVAQWRNQPLLNMTAIVPD